MKTYAIIYVTLHFRDRRDAVSLRRGNRVCVCVCEHTLLRGVKGWKSRKIQDNVTLFP